MREASKSRKLVWQPGSIELQVLKGKGLDIGAGDDPVTPDVQRFDTEHGDANEITKYIHDQFDFVYASHCLEHMYKPREALLDWWNLVRVGGHIFFAVPDEDLYEQGVFPSRFNPDHKATFTISKTTSWSSVSINVLEMAKSLPNGEIVLLALQDINYDRTLLTFGPRKKNRLVVRFLRAYVKARKKFGVKSAFLEHVFLLYRAIDQTLNEDTLAQIACIVKKIR
jgi:SAM-dependent methyltransferase